MQISNCKFILGSASPRRSELFARFWGDTGFEVKIPEFDEQSAVNDWLIRNTSGKMGDLATALAEGKARKIAENLDGNYVIIAADTLVIFEGLILGKPENAVSAREMLNRLSGRVHEVITGISLVASVGNKIKIWNDFVKTEVEFCEYSAKTADWYVSTGEPLDKAGAYGIQGLGSVLVKSINGCYYNVMGLPVNRLMTMLQQAAISSEYNFISGFLPWN